MTDNTGAAGMAAAYAATLQNAETKQQYLERTAREKSQEDMLRIAENNRRMAWLGEPETKALLDTLAFIQKELCKESMRTACLGSKDDILRVAMIEAHTLAKVATLVTTGRYQ